jgi:hypothetical protein
MEGIKMDVDKKEIKQVIEKEALIYEKYNNKIAEFEVVKGEAKKKITKLLSKLKLDSVDLDKKAEQILRVQMVHKKKVNYDAEKIESICEKRGGSELVDLVIQRVVNDKELDNAYNEGVLNFKDIEKCVKDVKESSYLLIKRVKKEIKEKVAK